MAKKESLNVKESKSLFSRVGVSAVSPKVLGILEVVLGVALLPFVYGASVAFGAEFFLMQKSAQAYFCAGVGAFLAVYFFILEPEAVYIAGQEAITHVFGFFKPMVNIAPYLLPIYTIAVFFIYKLIALFKPSNVLLYYTIFIFGVTSALHLVFSARSIRSKGDDFLKGDYIFGVSSIYIINLMILSLFLGVMLKEFSFVNFCVGAYSIGKGIFAALFRQLFVPKV